MEYIERELERKFIEINKLFKAVLVIGARQVGKSTMTLTALLQKIISPPYKTSYSIPFRVLCQAASGKIIPIGYIVIRHCKVPKRERRTERFQAS